MKVSIIVPTLNEERLIEQTLKSIRNQDFEGKVEIIISDGNSTDRTREIAKRYCDKVVIENNRTIAAGRQKGAKVATGEILIFTDADVRVDKKWTSKMVKAFEDERVSAAYGWILPAEGNIIEKTILGWGALFTHLFVRLFGADYVAGSNMAVRKRDFDKFGGFDITIKTAEDTFLMQKAREVGRVLFVPSAKIYYSMRRVHGWGYLKYFSFHTMNFINTQLFRKHADSYEPIRKK
jgi:glycosyltransferase involved in cell wall biosynthesis